MLVIGLDIATVTGVAEYDTAKDLSAVIPWSFKCKGVTHEEKAADMGRRVTKLIRDIQPDFIAIEQPLKNVPRYNKENWTGRTQTINPSTTILLNQLVGAAIGICAAYNKPHAMIDIKEWRRQFIGFGTRKGWTTKEWKGAAREKCSQLGIKCTNNDMAEAVGVAFAAPSTPLYRMMQHGKGAE